MKSKKKIIIVSSIIVVIVAIIAIFTALYFLTDMFKTPKQLFFKYLGKQMDASMSYSEMLEQLESEKTKSYTSNTDLKINIEDESNYSSSSEEVYEILNKINCNIEQSVNPSENKAYNKINVKYDEKDIGTLELVQNDETYAIKSDYIDKDNYIALENKNLKDFFKKMGVDEDTIDMIPDEISTLDMYDLLYISENDQKSIVKTYKKFIDENLKNENFKANKNVDVNINGKDIKTTQYTFTINEEEAMNIAINFMNTLKQDEVTLNLIVDKYNKCTENIFTGMSLKYTESTLDEEITITKEKLIEYIDEAIKELEEEKEDADENSKLSISLYQTKGEVCKIDIESGEEKIITIDTYESNDRNYIEIIVPSSTEDKVIIDYAKKEENIEGNIKVLKDKEELVKIKFNITVKGELGKGTNETDINFSVTMEEMTIGYNINNKKEYKDDVEVLELASDNTKILNEMSKDDIGELFKDVATNFQKNITEKSEDLGLDNLSRTPYLIDTEIEENDSDELNFEEDFEEDSEENTEDPTENLDWDL